MAMFFKFDMKNITKKHEKNDCSLILFVLKVWTENIKIFNSKNKYILIQ